MVLARLKQETQTQHRRLEADLDLLSPELSVSRYRELLRRFYGFLEPWEQAVSSAQPLLLRGRSKIDILVEDLRFLGDSLSAIDALEHCGELPALETRTQVLGSMYVVEGSTLGGQLLRRHFAERFGFESQGARYFTGYGERTGPMWKQFGEVVNAIPAAEEDEAIYAACQTFSVMHRWLCTTKASA